LKGYFALHTKGDVSSWDLTCLLIYHGLPSTQQPHEDGLPVGFRSGYFLTPINRAANAGTNSGRELQSSILTANALCEDSRAALNPIPKIAFPTTLKPESLRKDLSSVDIFSICARLDLH
jgi:hypothetical protein